MAQTRWWWIRHAPVTEHKGRIYGDLDLNCDCSDRAAFQALARVLPKEAVWVTTPLKRTRQTAEALHAETTGLSVLAEEVVAALQEQSFGAWQGLTHQELGERRGEDWHRFWLAPAAEAPPGGESFAALTLRVRAAIDSLNAAHAGRDIVAVTHGGTIRAAIAHALDLPPERALGLAVGNLSLTRLDHYGPEDDPVNGQSSWGIGCLNAEPLRFATKDDK